MCVRGKVHICGQILVVYVHVCTHVCGGPRSISVFSVTLYPIFLRQILSLSPWLTIWLAGLVGEFQGFLSLIPQQSGYRHTF